jgi:type II secretory pathway pseudopilin PulG
MIHICLKSAKSEQLNMSSATRIRDQRRTNPAGFTLLELIAIVAISGILMSLLLPALSAAKEKSRRSVCGQNERQVILALLDYGVDNGEFLPSPLDNTGQSYHSIVLSDMTFSNIVAGQLYGQSNVLYCPNLVQAAGTMGGHDPRFGYTIGYSYLAAVQQPITPKGPDKGWSGPLTTMDSSAVIADANYWNSATSSQLTVAPHTAGGVAMMAAPGISSMSRSSAGLAAGSSSAAAGAMGGNVGSLDGSVLWKSIGKMSQYSASLNDPAYGNW